MFVAAKEMKRPERLKLVDDMRKHVLTTAALGRGAKLLSEGADVIEQLEIELDKIHENFLRHNGIDTEF